MVYFNCCNLATGLSIACTFNYVPHSRCSSLLIPQYLIKKVCKSILKNIHFVKLQVFLLLQKRSILKLILTFTLMTLESTLLIMTNDDNNIEKCVSLKAEIRCILMSFSDMEHVILLACDGVLSSRHTAGVFYINVLTVFIYLWLDNYEKWDLACGMFGIWCRSCLLHCCLSHQFPELKLKQ